MQKKVIITIINFIIEFIKNFYEYKKIFLTYFGKIKISYYPMFISYQSIGYLVDGKQTLKGMQLLKPGDIIGRNFRNYLQGKFRIGPYTSAGIYIGDNKVIHVIPEGVSQINVIDFLRCDGYCILRPKKGITKAINRVKKWIGQEYDFDYKQKNGKFYQNELIQRAYEQIQIQRYYPRFFNKQIKFLGKKIIFKSFYENKNFKKIYEFYPESEDQIDKCIYTLKKIQKKYEKSKKFLG